MRLDHQTSSSFLPPDQTRDIDFMVLQSTKIVHSSFMLAEREEVIQQCSERDDNNSQRKKERSQSIRWKNLEDKKSREVHRTHSQIRKVKEKAPSAGHVMKAVATQQNETIDYSTALRSLKGCENTSPPINPFIQENYSFSKQAEWRQSWFQNLLWETSRNQ